MEVQTFDKGITGLLTGFLSSRKEKKIISFLGLAEPKKDGFNSLVHKP